MATPAEKKAAFAAAEVSLAKLIANFVPSFFQDRARDAIKQHPEDVAGVVDDILAAAEKARAA